MPAQQGQSVFGAKYGNRAKAAAKKSAANPVDYGFQRLPAGITKGIARLTDIGFKAVESGKQMAGELYFYAVGFAESPKEVIYNGNPVRVRGGQTRLFRMMCDTKKADGTPVPLEDNISWAQNEMKKLGGADFDVSDMDAAVANLRAACNDKDNPLYFFFSTSEGKQQVDPKTGGPKLDPKTKKPYPIRVWENWEGSLGLEDYRPGANGGGMGDESGGAAAPSANGTAAGEDHSDANPEGIGEDASDGDQEDLDALAVAAGDTENEEAGEAARARLEAIALEFGIEQETVTNSQSWDEVVTLIREAQGNAEGDESAEDGEGEGEEPSPYEPAKGDTVVYSFTFKDAKSKKNVTKEIQAQVTAVNKGKRLVDLKNNADKKTVYKGVSWDLIAATE